MAPKMSKMVKDQKSGVGKDIVLKKPAALPVQKKPAANLPEKISQLQDDIEKEDGMKDTKGEGRDKGKAVKYQKMKDELPNWLVDLIYSRKYRKSEEEAMAETLMLGLYFQGNQQRFDMAAEKGEIIKVKTESCDDDSNVQFWAFRKFVIGKEEAKQTSHSAKGSRKLSGNDLAALKIAFKSLNWAFDVYSNDEVIGKDGWSSNAATLLEQARSALEKLSKEARGLMNSWKGCADMLAELKKGYSKALQHSNEISHMSDLQSYSDGSAVTKKNFLPFMKRVAIDIEALQISDSSCAQRMFAEPSIPALCHHERARTKVDRESDCFLPLPRNPKA
eukprot:s1057_g10.t2